MLLALAAVSALLMFPLTACCMAYFAEAGIRAISLAMARALDLAFAFFVAAATWPRANPHWHRGSGSQSSWEASAYRYGDGPGRVVGQRGRADADQRDSIGRGYEGTDEYMPHWLRPLRTPRQSRTRLRAPPTHPLPQPRRLRKLDPGSGEIVPVKSAQIRVRQWSAEREIFNTESAAPVTLALRLLELSCMGEREWTERRPASIRTQ